MCYLSYVQIYHLTTEDNPFKLWITNVSYGNGETSIESKGSNMENGGKVWSE